ncbi:hypothetical protein [Serratia sp. CY37869]|uniref:hypothetical protein n=1 Tax=Serratia sp. CY37869 TaxID=3383612 RepID=UPI003FA06608
MDNKLSELNKPRAFVVTGGKMYQDRAFTDKSTAERSKADRHDGAVVEPLYSQEYVSALLAELEAKDKRIVALERINKAQEDHINQQQDRIESLEKKNGDLGHGLQAAEKRIAGLVARLATPVRLPEPCAFNLCDLVDRDAVIASLREQGFTVEGDE